MGGAVPVFDISDGQGNLLPMARFEVLGRMYFPLSGVRHLQFSAWALIDTLAALPEDAYRGISGPPPQEFLKAIVAAPSCREVLVDLKDGQQESAYAAGAILWFVLCCKNNHPEYKPSLNKAWDVLSKAWSQSKTGRPSSISSLKRSWAEFKTVAHFWAAFDVLSHYDLPGGEENDKAKTYAHLLAARGEDNLFLTFLSMASSFARQAEEIVAAHGAKAPLLLCRDLWMPPADLLERSPAKGIEITPAPLPPEQVELLKARRAPRRYSFPR